MKIAILAAIMAAHHWMRAGVSGYPCIHRDTLGRLVGKGHNRRTSMMLHFKNMGIFTS